MNDLYREAVLTNQALRAIFLKLEADDAVVGKNIAATLAYMLQGEQQKLMGCSNPLETHILLLNMKNLIGNQQRQNAEIQASYFKYKNELQHFIDESTDSFMDDVGVAFKAALNRRKLNLLADLHANARWYMDISDSVKQAGAMIDRSAKTVIQKITNRKNGGEAPAADQAQVNKLNTYIETLFEKHFNSDEIAEMLENIIDVHYAGFLFKWQEKIKATLQMEESHRFEYADIKFAAPFEPGASTTVAVAGIASGIIGSASLALGWHTISYAFSNVFPPLAIFTTVATAGVGYLNKDKMLNKKEDEVNKAIQKYYDEVTASFYGLQADSIQGQSLIYHIHQRAGEISEEALRQYWQMRYGDLTQDHLDEVRQSLDAYVLDIDGWIESLDSI